jgi:hypothetical protein
MMPRHDERVVEQSAWARMSTEDPGHSAAYVERFRRLAAQGMDLAGEARLVDAMLPRGYWTPAAGPAGSAAGSPGPGTPSSASTATRC